MRKKRLSIIIPVFNEENTLARLLAKVDKSVVSGYGKELIVVDDGSTDGTARVLEKMKKKLKLIVLRHKNNQGKGAAVRSGIKKASGELLLIQDADWEYEPKDYQKLVCLFETSGAVVYGSRNIDPERRGYRLFVWGVWFLTRLNNLLYSASLTDVYTGYKLFPTKLIRSMKLESKGFEIEAEITAKILKKGKEIKEVAIDYNPRSFDQGKKIRLIDGLKGLWTMLRFRF